MQIWEGSNAKIGCGHMDENIQVPWLLFWTSFDETQEKEEVVTKGCIRLVLILIDWLSHVFIFPAVCLFPQCIWF